MQRSIIIEAELNNWIAGVFTRVFGKIANRGQAENIVAVEHVDDTRVALRHVNNVGRIGIGNIDDIGLISIALGMPEEQLHAALWEAQREQLLDRTYRFAHDRVQEAAYALTPPESRTSTTVAAAVLEIGM